MSADLSTTEYKTTSLGREGALAVVLSLVFLVLVSLVWCFQRMLKPSKTPKKQHSNIFKRGERSTIPFPASGKQSKRILLIANDVTLAHFARPYQLAKFLSQAGNEVIFATSPKSFKFISNFSGKTHSLVPTDSTTFISNLKNGRTVFSFEELKRQAEEDEAMIELYQPDLIIGDLRLSLSVTARIHGVPYASISNAYWNSRYQPKFVVPDLPIVPYLGIAISQFFFDLVRPIAFALHCIPMNSLRKAYGLEKVSRDIREVYCDTDLLLFSDIPEIYEENKTCPRVDVDDSMSQNTPSLFVGPILWSPEVPLPKWWSQLSANMTTIYVSLGSSGDPTLLPTLVSLLKGTGYQLLVSCLGANDVPTGENIYCADFLPGDAACAKADLVICNGGSPSTSAAIAKGVPVLGIPSNLDQFLNMHYITKAGTGLSLRIGELVEEKVSKAVSELIHNPSYKQAAKHYSEAMNGFNTSEVICGEAIRLLLHERPSA